ncbi:MAG: nuclear transport factor 2 family protein [Sphingobium sp.]
MNSSGVDSQTWCEISNLIAEHIWRIDHGRIMEALELYSSDPRLEFMPPAPRAGAYEGRAAVEEWFGERMKNAHVTCRHVLSNLRMTALENGQVSATHLLVMFRDGLEGRATTDPAFIADAEEKYIREADGWKLAERIITPIFSPA